MESIQIVGVPGRPRFLSRSELEDQLTYRPRLSDRDRAALINKVRTSATTLAAQIDRALGRTRPAAWLEHRSDRETSRPYGREVEHFAHPAARVLSVR